MHMVSPDLDLVERELRAGRLSCPLCEGRLRPWGWARRRLVRHLDQSERLRPRRSRCAGCAVTHVLMPVVCELDCVHEVPELGAWLKVPLGKLDTERMVPLDDDALDLIDRLAALRCPGRPLPHPRTGKPTEFLLTRHGARLSATGLRNELRRAAAAAGLSETTPHQLRHTYATALINSGVSLQALMALLGHQSANMSLRYARLFDATVRAD